MKNYKGIELQHENQAVASHQPVLIWALENSTGDVLELGTGTCSTKLIHELLKGTGRKIVSVDDDVNWMSNFWHMKNSDHDFMSTKPTVESWANLVDTMTNRKWGVVFVDQGVQKEMGDAARTYSAVTMAKYSDYVVAHDAEALPQMQREDYNWHMFCPKYGGPGTYIISKFHDLKGISISED